MSNTTFLRKPITFKYQFTKAGGITYNTLPVAEADTISFISYQSVLCSATIPWSEGFYFSR